MNVAELYLKLFVLVVLPLAIGMAFSKRNRAPKLASMLFACAFYFFQTLISFLAVWNAQLVNNAWVLPFIALAGWLLSLGVACAAQPLMEHEARQRGSFLLTLCISNHGYTLLGIISLVVFGEAGLAQATYTQLLIIPFIILVCFPIARHFGGESAGVNIGQFLRSNLLDKRNLPLAAMLAGLVLNIGGIGQPAVFPGILKLCVYLGTVISGVAVGLLFNASHLLRFTKENLFSLVYRSTLYPLFFLCAARLFNLNTLNTLILVLFGIVPSAIFSNLIADLFNLDKDLTNSVFIISTALFLVIILPIYLLVSATARAHTG
jgi:predicted permease